MIYSIKIPKQFPCTAHLIWFLLAMYSIPYVDKSPCTYSNAMFKFQRKKKDAKKIPMVLLARVDDPNIIPETPPDQLMEDDPPPPPEATATDGDSSTLTTSPPDPSRPEIISDEISPPTVITQPPLPVSSTSAVDLQTWNLPVNYAVALQTLEQQNPGLLAALQNSALHQPAVLPPQVPQEMEIEEVPRHCRDIDSGGTSVSTNSSEQSDIQEPEKEDLLTCVNTHPGSGERQRPRIISVEPCDIPVPRRLSLLVSIPLSRLEGLKIGNQVLSDPDVIQMDVTDEDRLLCSSDEMLSPPDAIVPDNPVHESPIFKALTTGCRYPWRITSRLSESKTYQPIPLIPVTSTQTPNTSAPVPATSTQIPVTSPPNPATVISANYIDSEKPPTPVPLTPTATSTRMVPNLIPIGQNTSRLLRYTLSTPAGSPGNNSTQPSRWTTGCFRHEKNTHPARSHRTPLYAISNSSDPTRSTQKSDPKTLTPIQFYKTPKTSATRKHRPVPTIGPTAIDQVLD